MAVAAAAMLVSSARDGVLRSLGYALVAEDPLEPADVIAIAPDVGDAGVLEAADLAKRGIAQRVLVVADARTPVADELARRGIDYRDEGQRFVLMLRELGIPAVEDLRLSTGGTSEAAAAVKSWALQRTLRSVLLVTGSDHSRRVGRVFKRTAAGSGVAVRIRIARYSAFAPERWWRSRGGLRTGLIELQKLALDLVAHPIS